MKKDIQSETQLHLAILKLEEERRQQEEGLKEQFHRFSDSIKPINIIKNSLRGASVSPGLKDGLLGTTVGLAAGYLSKKIFVGSSHNPLKRLIGTALMYGVTSVVTRNPEKIKSLGKGIWQIIKSKKQESTPVDDIISQE